MYEYDPFKTLLPPYAFTINNNEQRQSTPIPLPTHYDDQYFCFYYSDRHHSIYSTISLDM